MANPVENVGSYRNPQNAHLHDHANKPDGAWVDVESSNVLRIRYVGAGTADWLDVEFKSGGLYRYYNVPWSVYWGFIDAPSKGKYHHAVIKKGGYAFSPI